MANRTTCRASLLVLGAILASAGCGGGASSSGSGLDAGAACPSFDEREIEALRGSGRKIPDAGPAIDTGVNIPDSRAALLDETLCKQACGHLFAMLLAEKREELDEAPDDLGAFEEELEKVRPHKERTCIDECRRYGTLPSVRCVVGARSREALSRCDF